MVLGFGGFWLGGCHSFPAAVLAEEGDGKGEMASERASGETLAFNWSSDARHGDAGLACAPRSDQLLSRSATASSVRFLKC